MTCVFLFDVDRTLTPPRQSIQPSMQLVLSQLAQKASLAVVSGSDQKKVRQQIGPLFQSADWAFTQNGLRTFKKGVLHSQKSLVDHLGEENIQRVIKFCLKYISTLDLPKMRGTFIEMRTGMLNISPIGRNCSAKERDQFQAYDKKAGIRKTMIQEMKKHFSDLKLSYSIGGQISFDLFPEGFDKTFCLRYFQGFEGDIHFFGDKTQPGGNDYQIYQHPRTKGHAVEGPQHTIQLLAPFL